MAKPRCGNKDFNIQFEESRFFNSRANEFNLLRRCLRKLTYTIKILNRFSKRYSKTASNEMVENLVEKAFKANLDSNFLFLFIKNKTYLNSKGLVF